MNHHARRVGKIQKLPRQFNFHIISLYSEISKGVKILALRVCVSHSEPARFKGFRRCGVIVITQGSGCLKNHIYIYKLGRIPVGNIIFVVSVKVVHILAVG